MVVVHYSFWHGRLFFLASGTALPVEAWQVVCSEPQVRSVDQVRAAGDAKLRTGMMQVGE